MHTGKTVIGYKLVIDALFFFLFFYQNPGTDWKSSSNIHKKVKQDYPGMNLEM